MGGKGGVGGGGDLQKERKKNGSFLEVEKEG